jgi:hypothetical protein
MKRLSTRDILQLRYINLIEIAGLKSVCNSNFFFQDDFNFNDFLVSFIV